MQFKSDTGENPGEANPDSRMVLEFEGLVVDPGDKPLDLQLRGGAFAFLKHRPISACLLGLQEPTRGKIEFLGKAWQERSVAGLEEDRRKIGQVIDCRRRDGEASWVNNLNVDENVFLAASFQPRRAYRAIEKRAADLAEKFGFESGLPGVRPSRATPSELIRAQWVRAFLPDPLELLFLESPTARASAEHVGRLGEAIREALDSGVAVLWVSEAETPDSVLDFSPEILIG